jgi:phosphomannomutase
LTLIKSISGIRGTIGGQQGENLTPVDIVECTAAYGTWLLESGNPRKVIVGRDGRISGPQVSKLAINTLLMQGIDVVDLGLSTTPTVEMAVKYENAGGGIIFTASHNPKEYNALKFLNEKGEFISANDGETILQLIEDKNLYFSGVDELGVLIPGKDYIQRHIDDILSIPLLDIEIIKEKAYTVVVDCINSTGAISVIPLLEQLNCKVIAINNEMHGDFAHNPEPLAKHLTQLSKAVRSHKADMGIAVDPDVDRLAFMCEDGVLFGEEYTLVAVADFVLSKKGGNTVSNLSSTRALADITRKYGYEYHASAVGEVNVVNLLKETKAVIGGEGNGGVIYPELHYGRDALVGIALFLNLLASKNCSLTELKATYPHYEMIKDKIQLTKDLNVNEVLQEIADAFKNEEVNTIDGVKIDFSDGWVHLRKSNTEPIIRVYSESKTQERAEELISLVKDQIHIS